MEGGAVRPVRSPDELAAARDLFVEYAASLGFDLGPQGFDREVAGLPGRYGPPTGALLVGWSPDRRPVGAVGLRALAEPGRCEIKRLYVRAEGRGLGLGRALAAAALASARGLGFREVVLDTLPTMGPAIALYRSLGFAPIPPYWENPVPGTIYFGRRLGPEDPARPPPDR